jgi:hypothetical protein
MLLTHLYCLYQDMSIRSCQIVNLVTLSAIIKKLLLTPVGRILNDQHILVLILQKLITCACVCQEHASLHGGGAAVLLMAEVNCCHAVMAHNCPLSHLTEYCHPNLHSLEMGHHMYNWLMSLL